MRILVSLLLVLFIGSFTRQAQSQQLYDADKVIMRLRVVCNQGQGGTLLIAFDIKARAGGGAKVIGGFSIVLPFNATKLIYQGNAPMYNQNYWGLFYSDYAFGPSAWFNQHATHTPGNALPLNSTYFTPSSDCGGNPLNDGFFEVMRYQFKVGNSANGTVDFGFYQLLPYKAGQAYQQANTVSAIFYSDLQNNGNDSTLLISNLLIPVELSSFIASPIQDGSVSLTWKTQSETSNLGFEVERGDGTNFERIAFVNGAGTKTSSTEYEYIDKSPQTTNGGYVYYRLKQIDTDGSSAYSPITSANLAPMTVGLGEYYPNPAQPGSATNIPYNLVAPATVSMHVYNTLGQKVKTLLDNSPQLAGRFVKQWDGTTDGGSIAPAGMYFVRFSANVGAGEVFTQARQLSILR